MSAGTGRLLWLTCAVDGVDHAITDSAFLAAQGQGHYLALCRSTVWASSLASPPAGRCRSCAAAADEPAPPASDRSTGRLWQRLVQRPSA